jgi:beta-mannosidase
MTPNTSSSKSAAVTRLSWAVVTSCVAVGLLLIGFTGLPATFAHAQSITKQDVPLNDGWQFTQRSASDEHWLPAKVPGNVHLDLLGNKLIPDPYYRDNEAKLQWIVDANWSYRTTFEVTPEMLRRPHLELVFNGLDTTAHVSLNRDKILDSNNMFRQWRVDAKSHLHPGKNTLRVDFDAPGKVASALAAADKTHELTGIPDKAYLRKAAYEYGWDWGPKFVTNGIWQPVSLEIWDQVRIADVHISQTDVTSAAAHLSVEVTVQAGTGGAAEFTLNYGSAGGQISKSEKVFLHPGENKVFLPVEIEHPSLWYPAGYGNQNMYSFRVQVGAEGKAQDEKTVRTGLRSVQLHREQDQWGRSFELVVNGIPIFAKGANVIPFDSFPNRVTIDQYRSILGSARDANMNMIRLWGGGYYESEDFYNLCDELGLMVWQDFMFASSWYPSDFDWKHNVELEATYQVDRLRNHPSMTLWSGNNEVESVLNAFLFKQSAEGKLQIWKNYLTTFSGILPNVIEREDPEVPYWPSSPSADYEETSDAFQSGDSHDWSIWHGREPFQNYEKHFARFNSEYGFQSFPELRTVESFTTPEDRANIFTPVMLAHQKNSEGNSIIHEYLLRDYAEPKDFPSFLYVSQVLQAEGVKVGAEHMRRSRPRIMGSLFWQLNDCWPVASWSSIDYYGRWKALQYYARRFYNPLLVSTTVQDGSVEIYGVSDKLQATDASLKIRLMTMNGKVLSSEEKSIRMPELSSQEYMRLPLSTLAKDHQDLSSVYVVADLSTGGKPISRSLVYLEPTKLVHLLPATIQSDLTQDESGYHLRLSSPVLARDVYIAFGNEDVKLSDNYIDLIPSEPVLLDIASKSSLTTLKQQMKVISLVDAFSPDGVPPAKTEK